MKSERVEDIHPLTPLQRGILFHTVLAPEAGDYLAQLCFTLEGALDAGAFERAWQTVAARHPALRSAFVWQGVDEPVQVVRNERGDWSIWPADRDPPAGWQAVGVSGEKAHCLEYIERQAAGSHGGDAESSSK